MANQEIIKEVLTHLQSAINVLEDYGMGANEARILTKLENVLEHIEMYVEETA
jgi:hypothetical protein